MHTLFRRSHGIILAVGILLMAACSKDDDTAPPAISGAVNTTVQPLQYMLDNNPPFSNFDTLMKVSGYMDSLGKGNLYTLLVPDNNAFKNANMRLDSLLALPKDSLKVFVAMHMMHGRVTTDLVPQTITNPMMAVNGQTLYMSKPIILAYLYAYPESVKQYQRTLRVNGVTTNLVDQKATDGTLHVLDCPLRVPYPTVAGYLESRPEFSMFVAGLRKFNLFDQLKGNGPYTVYPTSNDAYIQRGITLSMINSDTFDAKHYQPWLYTVTVTPSRTFITDFQDAQLPNNGLRYSEYGTVQYSTFGAFSMQVTNYFSFLGPNYSIYNNIGPRNTSNTRDQQPAVNGVVMPLSDIPVYPDSVHINQ
ncbi:hypothetical protein A4H97_00130 [Niastella yeongjuensis]|uniref:FAS1 domain-containing protein n=1 Tax=Niastella yeongjuensis TaxID=354355 RepID=A0A1V9EW88_9BACT|nr:fasciclin domain-containing protein [Niastella yeongjuensis]OQP50292.1 hypothetical protein A4H97_00130 [Niastella yeongjuensis]SEN40876.1 Uncaracterized surface protein containing fasciclin (FAS1) repeats [Niastella yeongjuensis]